MGQAVVSQRQVTVGTPGHVPTIPAEHKGGRSTAVEKEDSLFASGQSALQLLLQRAAKDAAVTSPEFLSKVYDMNRR